MSDCKNCASLSERDNQKTQLIDQLKDALERTKTHYWNRCYASTGSIQCLSVKEFDEFVDGVLAATRQVYHANGVPAGVPYEDGLQERLKNPEFKKAYEAALAKDTAQDDKATECPKCEAWTGGLGKCSCGWKASNDSREPK